MLTMDYYSDTYQEYMYYIDARRRVQLGDVQDLQEQKTSKLQQPLSQSADHVNLTE